MMPTSFLSVKFSSLLGSSDNCAPCVVWLRWWLRPSDEALSLGVVAPPAVAAVLPPPPHAYCVCVPAAAVVAPAAAAAVALAVVVWQPEAAVFVMWQCALLYHTAGWV